MRKKFTMLLASLFLVVGTAWAEVYQKVPHTKWTVTAPNQSATTGNEGGVAFIQDENAATFYHSDWGSTYEGHSAKKGADGLQGFMVDMGSVVYNLSKITYTGRPDNDSGWAKKVRIYLYESLPEGIPADLSTLSYDDKETLFAKTNTALGIAAFDNNESGEWASDRTLKTAEFAETKSARYVLFIQDEGVDAWLTCADFHVWQEVELTEDLTQPKYYTIKNVRGGVYAQYNGASAKMELTPAPDTKGHLFYFTAGTTEGTYKIHNAVTSNKCAENNSWTAEGIDWYILQSGNTERPGYAISKGSDLAQQTAWNNEGGSNKAIAYWNGNDLGSTWVFESFSEELSPLGLKMSTGETKYLYNIRNDRKTNFANYTGTGVFSQTSATNPGSYWYFVEVPGVEDVPEGYKACYIYNAANDLAVQNHSNGYMSSPDDGSYPAKIYFVGPYEATYWGYVIYPQGSGTGWNDQAGSSVTDWNYKTDGSIWGILPADKTADQLIAEAATAKANALNSLSIYDYASYYTYSDEAIATAQAVVNAATSDNLKNALSGHVAINAAMSTLEASAKGTTAPAAGDYIQLKNRSDNKYLKSNDADAENTDNKNDLATLWYVEAGDNGNVKLKNVSTNRYIGEIRQSATVVMQEDVANAAQFSWTNQTGTYAVFKDVTGGNYAYGHVNGGKLVGWSANQNPTQWIVSNVRPLTITYKYNGSTLSEVTELAEVGTYTVSSPYVSAPYEFITIGTCTVDGTPLTATDGVFSFEVTGAATVVVELVDALPFVKTTLNADGSFPDDAAWYVVKQHSSQGYAQAWKYDAATGVTTEAVDKYDESHFWCFAGNALDLKIYNKVAGSAVSLTNTDPASMDKDNSAVWKVVKSNAEGSFAGKNPFCLQNGDKSSYLNRQGNVLKYWGAKDQGSTIMVIPQHNLSITYLFKGEELTDVKVNTLIEDGTTYTIENPYPYKYVDIESCTVNGTPLEAKDGVWSLPVTDASEVVVTLAETLPFKTSTDYNTAVWHYLQVNSNNWKYVQLNTEDNSTKSTKDATALGYESQWAFIGDAINGFKILNKESEVSYSLSVASTDDTTPAYMVEGEKTWTIERGNGGFIIRQGETECLNDYGGAGVLKVWNHQNAPTNTGSAFRALEFGVQDLSELINLSRYLTVFALQAERSPLMYSTTETTKLSSGLFDQLSENASDVNQQFVILRTNRTPEGYFYLYSLGAQKFVGADLTFTDYPEPVLSFESSGHAVYPWWVKIADKYVIPANGGTDGNKLYHIEGGEDDDGKRYRIVNVGSYTDYSLIAPIEEAEDMIKDPSELSNEKVYTVSTYAEGSWYHNSEKTALWSTGKDGIDYDASSADQQFAFLTVAGNTYIYSIGAEKFVVKAGEYTIYSDEPSQSVELLDATGSKFYPFVAAFVDGESRHHIGISNGYDTPVITFWNDLGDKGNKIKLREVTEGYMADGAADLLTAAVAKIDNYLAAQILRPELEVLIGRAGELLGEGSYLDTEDTEALTNAKNTAQGVYDNSAATAEQLTEQIELLTEAITAVTYVREAEDFKNTYVYTFLSNRSTTAYMMYDGTNDFVASPYKQTELEVGADKENCQWAVYKSTRGNYYMYNLGAQKFMGTESAANTGIPFSVTPQTTDLTFKVSTVATHPIMISSNGGGGAVNHSNDSRFTNNYGVVNWSGGLGHTADNGNVHQVAIVDKLAAATLATIAEAVELYEVSVERAAATQVLEAAIAAAQAKVDVMSDAIGYYSSNIDDVADVLAAIVSFKEGISDATEVSAIEEQTAAAEAITASFSLNLPQPGKFYRFKHPTLDAYMLSDVYSGNSKRLAMGALENNKATSIFYYKEDGTLLSYAIGQYLSEANDAVSTDWTCKSVGATAPVATFGAGSALGRLGFYLGDDSRRAYYSARETYVDAGGSFGSNAGYDWIVEEVTELPVTVTSAGYATLYAPVALTIPDDVTAYTAMLGDASVNLLKIEGGIIPANTGVMIEAPAGTYNFVVTDEAAENVTSDFVGSYPKSNMKDGVRTYTLQAPNGAVGFYLFKGTKSINGFRAWIELPASSNVQSLRIRFGGATDIKGTEADAQGETFIYDLTGRRIERIVEKGVYIVNGKKIVVK